MSLINEALKKAQRQRTDTAPLIAPAAAPAGGPPSPRIVKRRAPMPARTLMLLLVGGGLLLVTAGIVTFVLLNLDSTPIVAVKSALGHRPKPVPPADVTPAIPTVTLPAIPRAEAAAPTTTLLATAALPVPSPVPAPEVIEKPVPVVAAPPPPAQVAKVRPPAAPKLVANPAIYAFIETLRITGVRASGRNSKVIMNDRIVRLDDYVDRTLGLRLTKIIDATPDHASGLVFTDENGFEYTKPL
jgi:hypothetical protein